MWMPKGECVEVPAPGTNRKVPIYGALNYRTNKLSVRVGAGKNATEFLGFLAQLTQQYRNHACLLVLDNASYHTAGVVTRYLEEISSSIQALWLPPYSPELNDIERVWKYLKAASLANYDFGTVDNLRDAIHNVVEEFNRDTNNDLSITFRDPISKELLEAA